MTISMPAVSAKQALNHVLRGHGQQHTLPVLGQVQVQAVEGSAALTTNNLDRQVTALVSGAEYDEPGQIITVPIPQIKAALDAKVAALRDRTLSVSVADDGAVTVAVGRKQITKTNTLDEMPVWDEVDTTQVALIQDEGYRKVVAAAAPDDTRPVLSGIHVHTNTDGWVTLAAADGFRMGILSTDTGIVNGPEPDVIVPAAAFTGIPKGQPFGIHVSEAARDRAWLTYQLSADVFVIYGTRLIEGKYPDLESIVPQATGQTITLGAADVLDAATYATRYGSQHGLVQITKDGISVKSSDVGDLTLNGYDNQIGDAAYAFNGDFLKWAVEGDDELELHVNTPKQAAVVHQGSLTMVIMPMVIGSN